MNSAIETDNVVKPVEIAKIEELKIPDLNKVVLKKEVQTYKNIEPKNKKSNVKDKSPVDMHKTVNTSKIITSTNYSSDKNQNTKN
jgi:hypothetical protein